MGCKIRSLLVGVILVGLLVATTSSTFAATLTRQFTGTITTLGSGGKLGIALGDPISGSFTWDTSTLGAPVLFGGATLYFATSSPIAPNALSVTIGSYIPPAFLNENFGIAVFDNSIDGHDAVQVGRSWNPPSSPGGVLSSVSVTFATADLTRFSDESIPTEDQVRDLEVGLLRLFFSPALTGSAMVEGTIQLVPVPEPTACTLALPAVVALVGYAIRRRAA